MKGDVEDVLDYLSNRRNSLSNIKFFLMGNIVKAISFFGILSSISFTVIFSLLSFEFVYVTSAYMAFFAFLFLYALSSMFSTIKFLVSMKRDSLLDIKKNFLSDYQEAELLAKYDVGVLNEVILLLENRMK